MIQFKNLALRRGPKLLFSGAELQISPGERVGLVGDNGTGKSSLFALLRGELLPDVGDALWPARWRIAHVAQHAPASKRSATEFVIDGDVELRALEAALADAEARHDGQAAGELHARLSDHDAYTARSRAEVLLLGLGFRNDQLEAPVDAFSGGWRMRLALAQTLMRPSDLLLLDEPTNHLDLDAIVWLEDWLRRYAGTMIVVSHDRDFLDAVATSIVHIDQQRLVRYGGNYSAFEHERALQSAVRQSAYERQQDEIARLQSFIDRFKAKATKAKQAQSRVKALERMEKLAPAHADRALRFSFEAPQASPDPMVVIENAACGYGDRAVLSGVQLELRSGERIGLLGANGQGKSTFIRSLVGELPWLSGRMRAGKGLAIGYFAQYAIETLDAVDTPLSYLARIAKTCTPNAREQELRDFLGRFQFGGDAAMAPIGPFSGGEKARLALAAIVYQRPNLLLLDEPTNHLDLETREALTLALASFDGSLIVVSHDRHLLRSTADRFLLVADGGLSEYDGDLDDYRNWLLQRANERRRSSTTQDVPKANIRGVSRREEAAERRRLSELKKPIEREISKLEASMARLEQRIADLDTALLDPALPQQPGQRDRYVALMKERAECAAELAACEEAWLERQEALELVRVGD
ncbi:MAG TPA: ATP-binding cassette domain-containing protein [Burkholderiaceae bacterium]|nr:ATP-binding cassette domain-containing protein [Burkholderiaceae bacterium]